MNSWIEWKGGERPVSPDEMVDITLRTGQIYLNQRGDSTWWNDKGRPNDIIAYRLHKPEPQCCESVTRTIPDQSTIESLCCGVTDDNRHQAEPTIESLAADYRAKLAIYEQAQDELNSHRCRVEAALSRLEIAGMEIGLKIEPNEPENEPDEPEITDWRDLRVGDVVEVTGSDNDAWRKLEGKKLVVTKTGDHEEDVVFTPKSGSWVMDDNTEWRFIRRP